MNILIIKETSLGDVLHSTVSLDIIKSNYPDSHISFLVDKSAYPLLKYNKKIDRFILFDFNLLKNKWLTDFPAVFKHIISVLKEVRSIEYDIAYDLQGLLRSVFFLYLAKAKRKYVKGKWLLLNKYRNKSIHAISEITNLLIHSGLKVHNNNKLPPMEIYTSDKEKDSINRLLKKINPDNKKILMISPFTRGESKDWGVHKYKSLLKLIEKDSTLVLFTGSPEKKSDIDFIIKEGKVCQNVYNLAGNVNLLEYAELLRRTNLLLSSDSFPVHLAGAYNIPVIALFGPTDENRVGPVSEYSVVIRAKDISCKKCYNMNCSKKYCMDNISPGMVYKKINEFFSSNE